VPRESVHAGPIMKGVGEPFAVSDRSVPDRPISDRRGVLEALRAQIRAIECDEESTARSDAVPFGIAAIDQALPWGGLPRAALHAIAVDAPETQAKADTKTHTKAAAEAVTESTGAATGFAAALLGRLCGGRGHALWCLRRGDLYAPGLAAFGVDPARLLVVRVERPEEVLWVLEEALACGRFDAVLGEAAADLTASRRLQLAARDYGTACLLLDRGDAAGGAAAALTRWHLDAVPGAASLGGGPAAAGWRVTLARCRGGAAPHHWTIGWCHETCDFIVAAALADRPSMPARPVAWQQTAQQSGSRRAG